MLHATDQAMFVGATLSTVAIRNAMFPSVKLAVTTPELAPVAVTLYVATNVAGSWNCIVNAPDASAVTSLLYDHVWPLSSFTKMWTDSLAPQPWPLRVTVEPGL